ncbi:MAG: G5 domain-containing protein [Oscillospiraceae bacterium]|nr:G5 domain-containing protein [Oscillospiraceae bacterium]
MNRHSLQKKLYHFWKHHGLGVFMLLAVFCVAGAATDRANALYILTGTEDAAIVLDGSAQVQDFSSQLVYLSTSSTGYDVTLTAGKDVTIVHDGETTSIQSKRESVSALLSRMNITPSPLDMVAVDLSGGDVTLTVDDQLTYYDRVSEAVSYETVRVANPNLPEGTEQVTQAGADGVRASVYEVVWSAGEMVSRQFVEELDSTAVDEIIEYGTAKATVTTADQLVNVAKNGDGSGTLTFASGASLSFSDAKSMTATAYTAGHGGADYTTATGTFVAVGTVAVDKSVIPLGTKMYIVTADGKVTYGMAVAADTGVRGNIVDLYYDTYQQCINFGRRSCTVYILE